jgi:hypothetical protein
MRSELMILLILCTFSKQEDDLFVEIGPLKEEGERMPYLKVRRFESVSI